MKTNFAEIDDAVTTVCERELATPTVAPVKATAVLAGFHLPDTAGEEALVEEAVRRQQAAIRLFQRDRHAAKQVCIERGIEPLAVIPAATWAYISEATGLFRLSPGADGTIGFSPSAFSGIKDERGMSGEAQVDWLAANRPAEFLHRLFPDGTSLPATVNYSATLVMPVPPPEVAEVLLKAKGLDLKVATVAEAIAFKETPSELYRRVRSAEEARARWLRDDPIVYFEVGTATAIIAQFGDFPIEQEVVARVLAAENLLRIFPADQVAI
jgi:hypothetical protein